MEQNSTLKKLLCEILHDKTLTLSEQTEMCFNRIESHHRKILKDVAKDNVKRRLQNLKSNIEKKFKKSKSWTKTLRDNKDFFEIEFSISDEYFEESSEYNPLFFEESFNESEAEDTEDTEEDEQIVPDMEPSTSRGIKRKLKPFDKVSDRQKLRRLDTLETSIEEAGGSLIATLKVALRLSQQEGKLEGVKILKEYIKSCEKGEDFSTLNSSKPKQLELDVAVGIMAYNDLSRNQFRNIQQVVKRECGNIFPPVNKLLIAKKDCYPENLTVDDTKAAVPVKDLTFHTTKRIVDAYEKEIYEKIKTLPSSSNQKIFRAEMIVSWGMDGTTGQSQYNQAESTTNEMVNDKSLMTASISMQQLRFQDESENYVCLWDNENSQSVYSVRPIQLEFKQETDEAVKDTFKDIEDQISKLGSERFFCNDVILEISYNFYPTMIDGKVYSIVTDTPSKAVCQCCGSTPTEMSNINNLDNGRFKKEHRKFKKENLRFNLQPLHTTINVVTHLYDISFRKNVQKHYKHQTAEEKQIVADETKAVKAAMWDAFHVHISEPRQGGIGTSNTGNVARKVLSNPELLADTLGLDEELVTRICGILQQIRGLVPVDSLDEFEANCTETYRLFLTLYPWYKIPVILHRVLAHGRDYMEALPLPLGRMSEEAGESQNKYLRNDRELRARKTSRKDNLTDVMLRRFFSSDPLILKKYMDVRNKKSNNRNIQDENEISLEEIENVEEEIELIEPEGEGYDYSEEVDIEEVEIEYS